MYRLFLTTLLAFTLTGSKAQENSDVDYTKGVFVVNEDWYGHNNSTINFLTDEGEWYYRVFQEENPGHELGCTSQYGTIYGNRMYIVSKQDKDPGATITGSRFVVCDATTMKLIKEFQFISNDEKKKSSTDGRFFLPVDEHKGYLGTNNGIWMFNMDNLTIEGQIKGTHNENEDGYGSMYKGQMGTMVRANDYVFAVHQQTGILVIDAKADTIVNVIKAPVEEVNGKDVQRGFGSIIMSKDGMLWASVAKDVSGNGDAVPYMLRIDPYTFDVKRIDIPQEEGIDLIPNSWYAWTADGFCASNKENKIYWKNLPSGGTWFSSNKIFGYDIDNNKFFQVIDLTTSEGNWNIYGTGFRIHPVTDEIYAFLYHDFQNPVNEIARISTDGKVLQEYPMIDNYWFPALPVFPDNAEPVVSDKFPTQIVLDENNPEYKLHLGSMVTDEDNMNAAIVKYVAAITPENSQISAFVRNDSLIVCKKGDGKIMENTEIEVRFNSNGKVVSRNVSVTDNSDTGIENVSESIMSVYPNPATSYVCINTESTAKVSFYNIGGTCVKQVTVNGREPIDISSLSDGIYMLHIDAEGKTCTIKLVKH